MTDRANGEGASDAVVVDDMAAFDTIKAAERGSVMEVRKPDKSGDVFRHADGRPFTITVLGKDSETFKSAARAQSDRRIAQNMRTRQPVLTAVIERDDIELLVAVTVDWDIILDGKKPPANSKEYRAAFTRYPWLKEQLDEWVGLRSNFTTT